jgi:hypothetical protein
MVVADLAIDKDNTVSVYCERDQTAKVEAMFTTPSAAQRPWVHATPWRGLTDDDIGICLDVGDGSMSKIIQAIEAKLKEKNSD